MLRRCLLAKLFSANDHDKALFIGVVSLGFFVSMVPQAADRVGRYGGAMIGPARLGDITRGLASLALGLLVAMILLGPQHHADFWAIDDHELIEFYTGASPDRPALRPLSGADNTATLSDLPSELMSTEVGAPGVSLRYRPVYYALRLLEVDLWGGNPADYYRVRTVMFGVLLASILWVGWVAVGPLGAVLMVLFALNLRMWGDVWCRLGTSEQYAAVGLALFLIGFGHQIRSFFRRDRASWTGSAMLLGLGLIMAAGSKENFVFMAVPVFLIGAYGLYHRRIAAWAAGFVALSLAFTSFIALAIARAAGRAGADVYGNAVSVTSRAQAPIVFLRQFAKGGKFDALSPFHTVVAIGASLAVLVALAGLLCVVYLWLRPSARARVRRGLGFVVAINLLAVVWALWEVIFYGGNWPSGTHYDFPGLLILLVFAGSVAAIASLLLGPGRLRSGLSVLGFVGLLAYQACYIGFDFPLIQAAEHNVLRTRQFSGDLQRIVDQSALHPDWPIIVEAAVAWDYEPVVTLVDWLRWKNVRSKVFLRVAGPKPGTVVNGFDEKLLDVLRRISDSGASGYQPIAMLDPAREAEHQCFSVSYSGPASPSCEPLPLRFMGD